MLGLGRRDSWVVQYQMGIPYRDPRASLKETVETVRALLSGSPVTSEGGQFNLANVGLATLPVQDRLPIYLAAIGPRALRLAGAVADGVLLTPILPQPTSATPWTKCGGPHVRRGVTLPTWTSLVC